MKITKIECIPLSMPFAKPVVMSGGVEACSDVILVKMHTDEGIVGIAETGGTSPWYQGESQDSITHNINRVFGPNILLGEDPFNIELIMARMDRAARANNQSKAVIDYALHDIVGKALGVPVYKLLGGLSNPKVPLGFVMSSGTPEEVSAEAKRLVKAGFKCLKLKVGAQSPEEDVELVGAVRKAVGPKIKLLVDANGGWHYNQALHMLKKLEQFDLFEAEQPVPWWDIEGLVRLRRRVDIPIFADESVTELNDLIKVIQRDAADGLFMKMVKAGGILKAQKWAAIAQAAGLPLMVGCMIDSGLGTAASVHFLAANEWMCRVEHGILGPLHLYDIYDTVNTPVTNDLAVNVPRYENGCIYPPDGPGLGIELNEDMIPKLMTPGKSPTVIGQ